MRSARWAILFLLVCISWCANGCATTRDPYTIVKLETGCRWDEIMVTKIDEHTFIGTGLCHQPWALYLYEMDDAGHWQLVSDRPFNVGSPL